VQWGSRSVGCLSLLVLSTACYEGVSAFGAGDASGGSTSGVGEEGEESGSGDTGEPSACDPDTVQVGHMPLRRLTRDQYANAVRDLFGVEADITAFGGDEKIGPFNANYSAPVSPTTVDQFRKVAEEVAEAVALDPAAVLPCDPATVPTCVTDWVAAVGRRAYRRPLTAEELARYDTLLALGEDDATRVGLVAQAMLQAPTFLYQLELSLPDPTGDVVALAPGELASRLSFFLWGSVPDDALLDAADAGELDDPAGLRAHAERLLDDPRARATVESFHLQWLAVDKLALSGKDPEVYPLFDEDVRAAMAAETRRFASGVIFDGDARLETLLTSSETWIDAPLFAIYGLPEPTDHDPADPVALDPTQRAGLLTQAGFLATHAHANQSGPIQRGVVVRSNLLCDPPPPPPPDINVIPPDPDPDATTREVFEMHTADAACAACHDLIDGIGLGFEGYDGIGVYREVENGQTTDQSGAVVGTDVPGEFVGVVELAHKLATSQQVRDCVATQWFRFSLGRFEGDADECTLEQLRTSFAGSDFDVRELMIALVQTDAFRYRAP
jgi:hypothetical protein